MDHREPEISRTRRVSHTGHLAHRNREGEVRGRSRHKSNSKSVIRNMEGRKVGTMRG